MNPAVANVSNSTVEDLASPLMTVVLPIIYIAVFVISTPCNLIALVLLCGLRKRATPTVVYSINLCLADLLYSITLPLQVDYHLRKNDWIFGSVICGISTTAFYCNMKCSILTTCAIAVERYCGVVRPMESRHLQSTRRAILTCLVIWTIVLAYQMPFFLYSFTLFVPQLNVTTCFDVFPLKVFKGTKGYLYFCSIYLLFFVVPMVILVVCSYTVARALRQTPDARAQRSYKRTQAVVLIAALCFVVCYLPNMIIQPIHMVMRNVYPYYKLSLGLNSLNCCFDPFVYYFASRELRQALWRVFCWGKCCPKGMGVETVGSDLSEMPIATRGNHNDSGAFSQ